MDLIQNLAEVMTRVEIAMNAVHPVKCVCTCFLNVYKVTNISLQI